MIPHFHNVRFYKSFTSAEESNEKSMPIPVIAITGRSNSGKSSIINALSGQKKLALVSQTPGKTKTINYYYVPSFKNFHKEFYLCDLPGYGFAKLNKEDREHLQKMIDSFIAKSSYLKLLLLIVDARRIPQMEEKSIIDYCLDYKKNLIILLNKWDKINQKERIHSLDLWQKNFPFKEKIIPTSVIKKQNIYIVIQKIIEFLNI